MENSHSQVFMVGALPPPVNGRSLIHGFMRDKLLGCNACVVSIDLAGKSVRRTWAVRLGVWRIAKIGTGLLRYCAASLRQPGATLYITLSGGPGQVIDLLFTLIGHCTNARIFVHHHSFAYIDRPKVLTRLLIRSAGRRATHVVLCAGMAMALKATYPRIENLVVISNAAFLPNIAPIRERKIPNRLGFLSNISFEKGILEFLDVMQRLCAQETQIRGYLAGAFEDVRVEKKVKARLKELRQVEYVGAKYGREKSEFFQAIDVLLFPTKYANEAEPVTILEAFAHGVPVIGWERGCIASLIRGVEGLLVPRSADFVSAAVQQVLAWRRAPEEFVAASKAAAYTFVQVEGRGSEALTKLLCNLQGFSA
jgi:glycosyltransferase involved in cell wall biosynthesis